jgi:hypothetical protein
LYDYQLFLFLLICIFHLRKIKRALGVLYSIFYWSLLKTPWFYCTIITHIPRAKNWKYLPKEWVIDCTILKLIFACYLFGKGALQEKFRLGQSQDVGISRKGEVVRFPPANPVRLDLKRSVLDIDWVHIFISVRTLAFCCYITVDYATTTYNNTVLA